MGIFSPGSQTYQKEQTPVSTHALVLWALGGGGGDPEGGDRDPTSLPGGIIEWVSKPAPEVGNSRFK